MMRLHRTRARGGAVGTGAIAVVVAACLLAGCAAVSGPSPVETFDLTAPQPTTVRSGRSLQVLVPEPVVDRAYDTDRLVVRPSATEIAYFSGAQWSDRLPRLIQSRLVQTLERSGRVRAVGRPGQGLAIDRQLVIDLRAFDYRAGEGLVRVAMTVRSMDDRTGRILATREFSADAAVAGDTAAPVVRAFDTALGEVLVAIADWIGR